jgi:hypothetical protein
MNGWHKSIHSKCESPRDFRKQNGVAVAAAQGGVQYLSPCVRARLGCWRERRRGEKPPMRPCAQSRTTQKCRTEMTPKHSGGGIEAFAYQADAMFHPPAKQYPVHELGKCTTSPRSTFLQRTWKFGEQEVRQPGRCGRGSRKPILGFGPWNDQQRSGLTWDHTPISVRFTSSVLGGMNWSNAR